MDEIVQRFDYIGNPVEIGDTIIYGSAAGRGFNMKKGVVIKLAEHSVYVKGLKNTKPSWYTHDFIVEKYIIKMNDE
jgi:hypothetical protein